MSASAPQDATASDTRLFLERLFPEPHPGFIEFRAWPAEKRSVERHFARTVSDAERIVGDLVRRHLNVFVGIALRRTPESGRKDNLLSTQAFWVDVDGLDGEGALEEFEIRHLETFAWPPSMKIWSGGGLHLYWCLHDPLDLTTQKQRTSCENKLRGLALTLGADVSCAEAARVMRVPGTVNYPDAAKRAKGRVPALCVPLAGLR